MRTRRLRLAFAGFGNVGRRFAELLGSTYGRILRARGVAPVVTGIATGRHGAAIDAAGLPLSRCLRLVRSGGSLRVLHCGAPLSSTLEFVRRVPADVLLELTPLDPRRGEPAISHVRAALSRGLHVVTANKGPVAFALRRLSALARRKRRRFLHEGAVMDGTPIFNLAERCLPGVRVLGFRGVLNSTTTRILSRMEEGVAPEQALREAQAAGVAEADPSHDLEGWDATVKGCALANALMGAALVPSQVDRTGIASITLADVRAAVAAGQRIRLVVRAARAGRSISLRVAPERIPTGDLLVSPGSDGVVVLETDLMGEIGIWEGAPSDRGQAGGLDQTAYAVLADLIAVIQSQR